MIDSDDLFFKNVFNPVVEQSNSDDEIIQAVSQYEEQIAKSTDNNQQKPSRISKVFGDDEITKMGRKR